MSNTTVSRVAGLTVRVDPHSDEVAGPSGRPHGLRGGEGGHQCRAVGQRRTHQRARLVGCFRALAHRERSEHRRTAGGRRQRAGPRRPPARRPARRHGPWGQPEPAPLGEGFALGRAGGVQPQQCLHRGELAVGQDHDPAAEARRPDQGHRGQPAPQRLLRRPQVEVGRASPTRRGAAPPRIRRRGTGSAPWGRGHQGRLATDRPGTGVAPGDAHPDPGGTPAQLLGGPVAADHDGPQPRPAAGRTLPPAGWPAAPPARGDGVTVASTASGPPQPTQRAAARQVATTTTGGSRASAPGRGPVRPPTPFERSRRPAPAAGPTGRPGHAPAPRRRRPQCGPAAQHGGPQPARPRPGWAPPWARSSWASAVRAGPPTRRAAPSSPARSASTSRTCGYGACSSACRSSPSSRRGQPQPVGRARGRRPRGSRRPPLGPLRGGWPGTAGSARADRHRRSGRRAGRGRTRRRPPRTPVRASAALGHDHERPPPDRQGDAHRLREPAGQPGDGSGVQTAAGGAVGPADRSEEGRTGGVGRPGLGLRRLAARWRGRLRGQPGRAGSLAPAGGGGRRAEDVGEGAGVPVGDHPGQAATSGESTGSARTSCRRASRPSCWSPATRSSR